jgi:pimeloyl-ACP methyl ester carboxylesterase
MSLRGPGGPTTMTTFALLPGAGSDSWFWSRVVPLLTDRGHEALAIDLPVGDDAASWPEYADVAAAAIGDRAGVVVVAQSMGAYTAPLVAARDDVDVARIDLLCPMIPAAREPAGAWWDGTGEEADPPGRDADLETLFFHDLPADLTAELMARGEPPQSDTPFGDPWPRDAWPSDIPTRVLAGSQDRLFALPLMRRLAHERLGLPDVDVVDAGHLAALSQPAAVADWLLAPSA